LIQGPNALQSISEVEVGVELAIPVVDCGHVGREVSNQAREASYTVHCVFDAAELGCGRIHNQVGIGTFIVIVFDDLDGVGNHLALVAVGQLQGFV